MNDAFSECSARNEVGNIEKSVLRLERLGGRDYKGSALTSHLENTSTETIVVVETAWKWVEKIVTRMSERVYLGVRRADEGSGTNEPLARRGCKCGILPCCGTVADHNYFSKFISTSQ